MSIRYIKFSFRLIVLVLLFSVTGCKVGPKYVRPDVVKDSVYRFAGSRDTLSMADLEWVSLFNDTVLVRLINTGLKNNFDMRIAFARIEEARANFKIERGKQWPEFGVGATGGWVQPAIYGSENPYNTVQVSASISWEIDLWGKLRRSKEAARANLFAQEAYRQAVRITLINEIVSSYFGLLEFDNEMSITQENIVIRQKSLDLVRAKLIAGTASGLVVAQAEAELALAKTQVPMLQMQIAMQENYLSTLLGEAPHGIARGIGMLDQINPPQIKTPGIPSQVIVRRPDIIMAEQTLVAANANIGVARAMMLPTLSISGTVGAALTLNPAALVYNAIGNLVAPVFAGGKLRQNVKKAQAYHEQMLITYQKTITNSLREVADALIQVNKSKDIVASQQVTVNAAQTAFDLSTQLYNAGYASYLDVINAQGMLFKAQIDLSVAQSNQLLYVVNLYTALGGGWK